MIRPFDTRVLIERAAPSERYKGIIIPARFRQAPQEGVVKAIGDKVRSVKPGDRVLFGRHSGIAMDEPGYLMLWERDLMGVVE
jgi:co-chaperonin GroES (HSP10)